MLEPVRVTQPSARTHSTACTSRCPLTSVPRPFYASTPDTIPSRPERARIGALTLQCGDSKCAAPKARSSTGLPVLCCQASTCRLVSPLGRACSHRIPQRYIAALYGHQRSVQALSELLGRKMTNLRLHSGSGVAEDIRSGFHGNGQLCLLTDAKAHLRCQRHIQAILRTSNIADMAECDIELHQDSTGNVGLIAQQLLDQV